LRVKLLCNYHITANSVFADSFTPTSIGFEHVSWWRPCNLKTTHKGVATPHLGNTVRNFKQVLGQFQRFLSWCPTENTIGPNGEHQWNSASISSKWSDHL